MSAEQERASLKGTVAFTGRLASMKRAEAFEHVRRHGGTPRRGVTKSTTLLIVGELGWPLLTDGRASNSLARAKSYGVAVASERRFLEWVGRAAADQQTRTYTAAQLSSLSGLPPNVIEQLAAFGLIDPREGRYRFRDLAAARQLGELFAAGVGLSVITKSLQDIRKWLPDAGLSNLKLFPAANDKLLVEQTKGRTDQKGQFVLPVGETQESPDVLFDEAQAAEEAGDVAVSERLYRRVMKLDPDDPAAAFNLGNLLRAADRKTEAESAYRAAVKADPRFAEAWYNLADLLDDSGRASEAITCLERALAAEPSHSDSIFNLALLLQRAERISEALTYWRRYVALDGTSEWATRARRSLKYCEMRLAILPEQGSRRGGA
ncbi:MAG: tetratricopeptide repeat protein [Hyphomicrobiales bacterium]|nr:tetratricopeptide repeat protein [Hyphomicrobiales bacterium]MBV8827008.1 tetratricopeptide repeat protein [Hyphomicrobiales bacterium]MBV9427549.1 tetratricopeptide repeat protein [Bradyrhizobiaceae bacterium]